MDPLGATAPLPPPQLPPPAAVQAPEATGDPVRQFLGDKYVEAER